MDDCIFCKIVKKEIPSAVAYEDDRTLAFMTIEAINTGHLLVIPKQHVPYMQDMDEDLYVQVMKVTRKMSAAVKKAFEPEKVGLMVSGWEIAHAHIHVVPMSVPSDVTSKKLLDKQGIFPSPEQLQAHAAKIAESI